MIGETLANFEITAKLGEGGMGEVYRAVDTKLGREVALKVLPEAVAGDPERLARFEREAKVLASLNHPKIAAIYSLETATRAEAEEGAETINVLVMELAEGEDLKERLERGPVSLEESMLIALQLAEALESAHEKGIIHRDLKPANIKLDDEGQIKVLDFGLAKALEGGSGPDQDPSQSPLSLSPTLTAQMTGAGVLLGTAAYMSPEQARGKKADKRADIWAFGVVLMEMLTGQRMFGGETVSDSLAAVLRAEPEWQLLPRDTPPALRRLLGRCLERDPKNRTSRYRRCPTGAAGRPVEPAHRISGRDHRTTVTKLGLASGPRCRWPGTGGGRGRRSIRCRTRPGRASRVSRTNTPHLSARAGRRAVRRHLRPLPRRDPARLHSERTGTQSGLGAPALRAGRPPARRHGGHYVLDLGSRQSKPCHRTGSKAQASRARRHPSGSSLRPAESVYRAELGQRRRHSLRRRDSPGESRHLSAAARGPGAREDPGYCPYGWGGHRPSKPDFPSRRQALHVFRIARRKQLHPVGLSGIR